MRSICRFKIDVTPEFSKEIETMGDYPLIPGLPASIMYSSLIINSGEFLKSVGLDPDLFDWPCWGKMDMIHTDNAKEFRGTMMARAAKEHGLIAERLSFAIRTPGLSCIEEGHSIRRFGGSWGRDTKSGERACRSH